jgi:subtilisin family serine protease
MAAPHISGLAALLLEARPEATVNQLEGAIFSSCSASPTLHQDRAGLGLPDAERALARLLNV